MIARRMPDLSVVIVNYHSEDKLAMCLRSLENSQEPVEVIVVDNGSDRQAKDRLSEAHPGLVWQSMGRNAGFAAACNAGARRARSEKLLFLNPDTVAFTGSLGNLARALDSRAYSSAIMGCGIENPDGTTQLSCRSFPNWKTFLAGRFSLLTRLFPSNSWSADYLMSDFNHTNARQVDWVSGAALGIGKNNYERLGGFDESFFVYFEDVDLCKRAAGLGIPAYYYPEARIQHLIGGSSRTAALRALTYRHKSMWTYYKRHLGKIWLNPFALLLIYGRLAALALTHILARFVTFARAFYQNPRETTKSQETHEHRS